MDKFAKEVTEVAGEGGQMLDERSFVVNFAFAEMDESTLDCLLILGVSGFGFFEDFSKSEEAVGIIIFGGIT